MKYLKEMDDWATSNRLGEIHGVYTEVTYETAQRSLVVGPPMRVKIKKTSMFYGPGQSYNPVNISGTIDECGSSGVISVLWDNGEKNSYYCTDLELSY